MVFMRTHVSDYKDALDHLPAGGTLLFDEVTWDDYEELLREVEDRPNLRLAYNEGKLQIMSRRPEHEEFKRFIERVVDILSDELDINVEPRGSATWKKKPDRGAEGDTCYYIANAERIIGQRDIDLTKDPPPDLVVEIDSTNESLVKFGIYAVLRIPEIWRYDVKEGRVYMYALSGGQNVAISSSRFFTMLTQIGRASC